MTPESTTPDEAIVAQRREAPYYCPGCGRPFGYPAECSGSGAAPHQPTQSVSTDELAEGADPDAHTAAPPSEG